MPGTRAIAVLTWPMALKAVFLHGTVVIDGWLVAPLGEGAVGALALAAALGGILLGAIFAFSHALQIRTAQAFGSGDAVFLKSTLASGLAISLGIGAAGLVLILVLGGAALRALAPDPALAEAARSYVLIFGLVILAESVGQALSSYFNGCGRTRIPFYGYCLSVPVNVSASLVLIHGHLGMPAFGVAGAAMGSALAAWLQVAFFGWQWLRSDRGMLRQSGWRHGSLARDARRYMIFAMPIAATFISASAATHICTLFYAQMDLVAFAVLALIAPWNMVAGQISMQWTQATGILVAQLLGQRRSAGALDRFLSKAWRGAFVAAGAVALVFAALGAGVDVLYPDLAPETRAILVAMVPLLMVLQIPRATNAICGNTLRAGGDTIYVMHIFLWSQWAFRVPATALAVLYFEAGAIWVAGLWLAEEVVKFPAFHRRLWKGDWKRADVAA